MSTSLEAKLVVLGSQNVGKTSLVHRFVHSTFVPPTTPSTVGASFLTTRVHDAETDTTIRLQIWDTAGQERFRSISKLYYRGAHAAVLCYDITSKRSFDEMGVWLRELKDKGGSGSGSNESEETILHIVGTKSDIVAVDPSKREVPFERCIDFVTQELYPETIQPASSHPTRPSSALAMRSSPPSSHGLQAANTITATATATATTATTLMSPSSNRSSGFWNHENVWTCCHEISAKDGEGIEEVFRVITRKLVEQHQQRLEKQRAIEATMGVTPGFDRSGQGYFDHLPNGGTGGSFRLGHGDKRRSWLGFPAATLGALSSHAEEAEEIGQYKNRKGRCC